MTRRAGTITRGALLLAILLILGWLIASARIRPEPAPAPASALAAPGAGPDTALLIPVAGVRAGQLVDTYSQARAGGARVHDAIDIPAPRGTPVLAAAAGTVEKLFFSRGGGGITIYIRSPDRRRVFYYAHLDGYAPGLGEGQEVRRGQRIGFVGSTGDASPEAPHLHFAINLMAPGVRWWQGEPVNPYPLLAGTGPRR